MRCLAALTRLTVHAHQRQPLTGAIWEAKGEPLELGRARGVPSERTAILRPSWSAIYLTQPAIVVLRSRGLRPVAGCPICSVCSKLPARLPPVRLAATLLRSAWCVGGC